MTTMILRPRFALAALATVALCVAACGGSKFGNCSVSFSGAFTGTYGCTATGSYNTAGGGNTSLVNVAFLPTGAVQAFDFGLSTTGDLHAGTYSPATAGSNSVTRLSLSNGQAFTEGSGPASSSGGTFSLAVTGLTTISTTSTLKGYAVHGTLDETLVASSGASGTVTVHASF